MAVSVSCDTIFGDNTMTALVHSARRTTRGAGCGLLLLTFTAAVGAAEPTGDHRFVEQTPGLVAFWTFAEPAGEPRRSSGTSEKLPLTEVGGPVARVDGGPFSAHSAHFDGKRYFRIPHAETGPLNISGPDAQVSMFAVVRLDEMKRGVTIAGIWSEGKGANDDTGTRQYAMLLNMPTYGGPRQLTPHISSEGGVTRRADGTAFPWCCDYAATRSQVPEGEWVTLGFTYDGRYIRAYFNGVLEERELDPVKDKRTDRYFTQEGPNGGPRGMNPYYHGRGIFRYDPQQHAQSKPDGPADFTVGARYAVGSMLGEALKGRLGGLAVFNRALTDDEMQRLHQAANIPALNAAVAETRRSVSGIYPHLAMFNDEGECGTGAVVPWADRLWAVTYAPHKPQGSSDKLYEITPELRQIIRPESIGGTPANRMIHRESQQLFIGPYAIDAQRQVRAIPYAQMFGRPTGNARHLVDPAGKIYCATMEEGLYEIDVQTLAVTELWTDEQKRDGRHANLPGYHGKGLYSGFGRVIYANNGEHGPEALKRPEIPSGVLATWNGRGPAWSIVRRNQFTEVTGPGGLFGNDHPERDPVWSIGWDHRSLLLMVLDPGGWHTYRLPKGSHSYDGAHGWNTEWPRIRDIGETDLLMTMHGTFWRFPKTFSSTSAAGVSPRSNYLKVVGDFCRWGGRLVLGCDDTAKNEFLNKRPAKGGIIGPGRSQSNLWFVEPETLDTLGPAIGRGAVWLDDAVSAAGVSDPYLFAGYRHRTLCLAHHDAQPVKFTLEVDARGDGRWSPFRQVNVPAGESVWLEFPESETGAWIRVRCARACAGVSAVFQYRNADRRSATPAPLFAGLAPVDAGAMTGGVIHARGAEFRTLRFIAADQNGPLGCYDLDGDLRLQKADDPQGAAWTAKSVAIPRDVLQVDDASVLFVDGSGRWRLPKGGSAFDRSGPLGDARVCREVCTERDLFHAHGTFYELPAENAGGFAKVRPIASHDRRIHDYASYRGLLVLSGVSPDAPAGEHIIRSDDGRCALWVGAVDDLWQLGKPRGVGGPWRQSAVQANAPSDPYLMTGYDRKRVQLSHTSTQPVEMRVEVDITGAGLWVTYRTFAVPPGTGLRHEFPVSFSAYWVRIAAAQDTVATATFTYE
jgi:hypothetical protein